MQKNLRANDQPTIASYVESFQRCYPEKNIAVNLAKGGYRVVIDGDKGNLVFTVEDLAEATAAFSGHVPNPSSIVTNRYRLDHIARITG